MTSSHSYAIVWLGVVLAGGWCQAQDELEDLRMPLQFYPDGKTRTELLARRAVLVADGTMNATNVTVRFLTESGELDVLVEADACVFHRGNQTATSTSKARLQRRDLEITGIGFEWHGDVKRLRILRAARVVFARPAVAKERILGRGADKK